MPDTRATSLCGLAAMKTWLQVTDTSDDARLITIGDAVSERIETYTNRFFATRTFTEVYDGDGSRLLLLREYPVASIASLTVKETPTSTPLALVNGTDYDVEARTGRVVLRSRAFSRGFQNVAATYDSGYGAKDAATLPADIYQAALDYIKLVWNELTSNAIAATQISAGNETFILKPQMPWGIKQTLDSWTRRRLL
jgi:hypothetical protein